MGVWAKFLKKRKLCLQSLSKEWKQPPVVISATGEFSQYIYSMLVGKNHQKSLAHEFSFLMSF